MNKPISKSQIRTEIKQQTADYLNRGGKVVSVPKGTSGRDDNEPPKLSGVFFNRPKVQHTFLPDIVAALEARRQPKPAKPRTRSTQPRRKLIYDDFGEPLRWEWVDE